MEESARERTNVHASHAHWKLEVPRKYIRKSRAARLRRTRRDPIGRRGEESHAAAPRRLRTLIRGGVRVHGG